MNGVLAWGCTIYREMEKIGEFGSA